MFKLIPIPMIGWGTFDVESLPSYILRSAYWHGVSGSSFIRYVFKFSDENEAEDQLDARKRRNSHSGPRECHIKPRQGEFEGVNWAGNEL